MTITTETIRSEFREFVLRKCESCGARFTTYECLEESLADVVSQDELEKFRRSLLEVKSRIDGLLLGLPPSAEYETENDAEIKSLLREAEQSRA